MRIAVRMPSMTTIATTPNLAPPDGAMNDPIALAALHLQVWRSPAAHASWRQESPHDTAQEAA